MNETISDTLLKIINKQTNTCLNLIFLNYKIKIFIMFLLFLVSVMEVSEEF